MAEKRGLITMESYPTTHRRVTNAWVIGPYTISEITGHGFKDHAGRPLYAIEIEGQRESNELYLDLDEALAAGIARRWTGKRGAGGQAVGTAADWFLTMIGARPAPTLPGMVTRELSADADQEIAIDIGHRERVTRGPATAIVRQAGS